MRKKDQLALLKELDNYKTFGMQVDEGMRNKGYSNFKLSEEISDRKCYASEKTIERWKKDLEYPDITIIYILAELLELNPNNLLKSKQLMQEAGINSINMQLMRVIGRILGKSLVFTYYFINILGGVGLIFILGAAWSIRVPIWLLAIAGILVGIGNYFWLS